jgi:hypothetical protein
VSLILCRICLVVIVFADAMGCDLDVAVLLLLGGMLVS